MLWSLSILRLGCRQGWDLALCLFLFFFLSVQMSVWVDEDGGQGRESLRESSKEYGILLTQVFSSMECLRRGLSSDGEQVGKMCRH